MATKRYELTISRDEFPESPREWDNIGTMLCTHRNYSLGDEKGLSSSEILERIAIDVGIDLDKWNNGEMSEEELYNEVINHNENAIILPLSLYDHSGITMSVGVKNSWDSGQVGFIYVTKDDLKVKHGIDQAYLDANPDWIDGRTFDQVANDILTGEVETYDTYLRGDVYRFILEEYNVDGELVSEDSCSGFFGDKLSENGMLDHFPKDLAEKIKDDSCWDYDSDSVSCIFVKTNDFELTDAIKERVINKLVEKDTQDIIQSHQTGDYSFLSSVLSGEGFKPYNQLSNKVLKDNYKEQFGITVEDEFGQETTNTLDNFNAQCEVDQNKKQSDGVDMS